MTPILAPRAIDAHRAAAALGCALVIDLKTGVCPYCGAPNKHKCFCKRRAK